MKAIRTFLLFTIFTLLVSFPAFAQTTTTNQTPTANVAVQEAQVPALPDIKQAPYVLYKSDRFFSIFHQEWGPLNGSLYVDDQDDPKNMVMVFSNEDGTLKYAEWMAFNDAASKATKRWIRGYNYKDGKWVFEKEIVQGE